MVTLCLCDLERGKYVFADIVEISVEGVGQVYLSPSPLCGPSSWLSSCVFRAFPELS